MIAWVERFRQRMQGISTPPLDLDIPQDTARSACEPHPAVELPQHIFIIERQRLLGEGIFSPGADFLAEQLCDIKLQVCHWFVYVHMWALLALTEGAL